MEKYRRELRSRVLARCGIVDDSVYETPDARMALNYAIIQIAGRICTVKQLIAFKLYFGEEEDEKVIWDRYNAQLEDGVEQQSASRAARRAAIAIVREASVAPELSDLRS